MYRKSFRRWWDRVTGKPFRLLMLTMSGRAPRQEYDSIRLTVADFLLIPSSERFFDRTKQALMRAAAGAPQTYAEFRKDVQQVVLWGQTEVSPYNRFQFAAVVSPRIALDADTLCYAVWLLHTSGLLYGQDEARARSEKLLRSLELAERTRVAAWLTSVTKHGSP